MPSNSPRTTHDEGRKHGSGITGHDAMTGTQYAVAAIICIGIAFLAGILAGWCLHDIVRLVPHA